MSKRIPLEVIRKVQSLREKGWSFNEIKKETRLCSGSVYRYASQTEILQEYQQIWKSKQSGSILRKRKAEEDANNKASVAINTLSDKERLIFLSALYWGEGGKGDFNLTNTDSELMKVFVKGLKEIFGLKTDDFRVSIRTYEDLDKDKCLIFWSKITGVPKEKFVNVDVLKGKKEGKLPYGMCRLRIRRGGNMLKYLTALRKQVTKLF
ncbi:hypothetical protein COS54_03210 [Candidatus Shapirobacteria bacterium CG03_land_8_20_14_0_80_39_12]|uniref:Resolvase HTH domain-containing protein n=1 Tax=Candidatus Shapirobacteria bacterium CG03_land_8_20_14_0_80_39_12 TaxID=1974879 RepID=A0A2M7BB60_9BACT|nr:MAG: hypothetical protein COS54_03210 [Candidatus Shapirobacteria bacterium CG03_land_8_20_14_0_80_39_12]